MMPWTNREATATRVLPASLVVLGAGPTGVELARSSRGTACRPWSSRPGRSTRTPRELARLEAGLRRDGVDIRTAVRALRVRANAGAAGLTSSTYLTGHPSRDMRSSSRSVVRCPLSTWGSRPSGLRLSAGGLQVGSDLRIADGVFVVGDPAGPEMHTHLAHYQGELAVRIALGDDVHPD